MVEVLVLRMGRGAVDAVQVVEGVWLMEAVGVMGGVGGPLGKVVTSVAGVMVITGDSGFIAAVGILM